MGEDREGNGDPTMEAPQVRVFMLDLLTIDNLHVKHMFNRSDCVKEIGNMQFATKCCQTSCININPGDYVQFYMVGW